jgi:hypothetical protein
MNHEGGLFAQMNNRVTIAHCPGATAMNFGIFYEHQLPRAGGADWDDDAERRLYQEALEQVELADRVGIDYVWEVP